MEDIELPPLFRERVLIAKAAMETLRTYSRAYWKTDAVGEHIHEILISIAVVIGMSENRLMTATDIAAFTGFTRPTVVRYLRKQVANGFAVMIKDGRRQPFYQLKGGDQEVLQEVVKLFGMYAGLCDQLSKMTNIDIARLKKIRVAIYRRHAQRFGKWGNKWHLQR